MLHPVFEGDDRNGGPPWLCGALDALWIGVFAAGATGGPTAHGLVAGELVPAADLGFFAFHASGAHLAVSLAWLALAGPGLEARFGRVCFGGLLGLAVAAGAALTLRLDPEDARPLVGASAGLAALLGAAAVRFRRGLALRVGPGARASFRVALPGWLFPLVWLLGVIALRLVGAGGASTAGPELPAQLALAAGGAAFAGVVHATGLEERWLRGRARAARDRAVSQRLSHAEAEVARGHPDAAFDLLCTGLAQQPDPRLVGALLAAAAGCGRRGDALAAAVRAVTERWRAGQRQLAAALWTPLVRAEPDVALDMRLRLALAPMLAAAGLQRESALTLRGELRAKPRGLTPGAALRIADAARSVHLPTAIEAARLALAGEALDAAKRARIEALVEALENDPRALAAVDLDPRSDAEAPPAPGAEAIDDVPADPRALALAEADVALELDEAGGAGASALEDPRAIALDPDGS